MDDPNSTKEIKLNVKIKRVQHKFHVDRELNWTFNSKIDQNTIFHKIKEITKDDYGTIYEILYIPSDTHIIGKTADPNSFDSQNMELIKKEFEVMNKITSEYIIRYYGSLMLNGNLTFLMEYYEYGSIRDLINVQNKVLNEQQISIVMSDLLNALSLLHDDHKIVIRDIRASKIYLTINGRCRLMIFGFTRCFDLRQEARMPIILTPYWLAPECINEEQALCKSDIWSVGITAIECAIGAPPYIALPQVRAMIATSTNGLNGHFPLQENFSPEFADFVFKCTVIDPLKRPSAKELLSHPFVRQAETIDRAEVMSSLLQKPENSPEREIETESNFEAKTRIFIDKYKSVFENQH